MIEKGLAFTTFSRLMLNTGLTQDELADVVPLPTRTLNRRKKEGRLEPVESDRLLRTSRIFGDALSLVRTNWKIRSVDWNTASSLKCQSLGASSRINLNLLPSMAKRHVSSEVAGIQLVFEWFTQRRASHSLH
jgi:hypothetical protein